MSGKSFLNKRQITLRASVHLRVTLCYSFKTPNSPEIKDPSVARKVEGIISELKKAETLEEVNNIKKMKGYSIAYRIRMGQYRMGLYKEPVHIEPARFLTRSDIYKVFPKKK